MANKMPFDYVMKEVDKLYDNHLDEDDVEGIIDMLNTVTAFLEAAGWTEEEFIETSLKNLQEFSETPIKIDISRMN
ncbi:hypothetical protein UFOVP1290_235 [uncultured Caudovirales phage]|uniref:Uncharacterized protein n=1 Tax=uncultured Caudovirales phage TaxID=2100421 RepID=A0A6J5RWT2_9CAUD|nr:hypothetical protein UFOVP1290_235 [uncultured Caudovirales phage]